MSKRRRQSFADRRAMTFEMLTDPDARITTKEFLVFGYNWFRFEKALIAKRKANQKCEKYARRLNDNKDVFAFRKSMKNL